MNKGVQKAIIAVGSAIVAAVAGIFGGKTLSNRKEQGRRRQVEEEELERERKLRKQKQT